MRDQITEELLSLRERAYRIAYSYLHHEQDSLDAVCDAFEKALKRVDSLKEPEYLQTWFIRIVINQCKMMRRKAKVLPLFQDVAEVEVEDEPQTDDILDLEDELNQLSPTDRKLIFLKFYMGYTLDEISQVTQLPIGTVKTKIYRNLRDLRHKLDPAYEPTYRNHTVPFKRSVNGALAPMGLAA